MPHTRHSLEKVVERTRMTAVDVRKLMDSDAYISLGTVERIEYRLFYDPFMVKYKIALIAAGTKKIVSIWETNYSIPEGVRKPHRKTRHQARKKYQRYVFQNLDTTPSESSKMTLCEVKIGVMERNKTAHTSVVGKIPWSRKHELQRLELPETIVPKVTEVFDIVEKNVPQLKRRHVAYEFYVIHPNIPSTGKRGALKVALRVTHKTLEGLLKKPLV